MTTQRMFRTAILPFAVAILLAACGTGGTSTAPVVTELPPGGGPGIGGGALTIPQPGQLDVRPIAADTLEAQVNGRGVVVTVHFQPRATRLQPRAAQPSPACELLVPRRTAGPMGGRA